MNIVKRINQEMLVAKRDQDMMPPWYYGYAYRDIVRNRSVFAVMPLNWLIRWGRQFKRRWDIFRGLPPTYELVKPSELYDSSDKQYRLGYEDGYALGKRDMTEATQEAYQRGYDEALAFFAKTFYPSTNAESDKLDT